MVQVKNSNVFCVILLNLQHLQLVRTHVWQMCIYRMLLPSWPIHCAHFGCERFSISQPVFNCAHNCNANVCTLLIHLRAMKGNFFDWFNVIVLSIEDMQHRIITLYPLYTFNHILNDTAHIHILISNKIAMKNKRKYRMVKIE